jgi:hypothetical protein
VVCLISSSCLRFLFLAAAHRVPDFVVLYSMCLWFVKLLRVVLSCAGWRLSCCFVWVPVQSDHTRAYELAALQAVSYLGVQNMYGFLVVHYSFQGLVLYKTVARASVSLAARATEVANVAAN